MKTITHIRKEHFPDAVIGELFLSDTDERFCYTLEDTEREGEAKVYGKTAIPKGEYYLQVRFSPHFKREMIYIYNDYSEFIPKIVRDGKSFSWVMFHGGNTVEDSEGCVLIAFNRSGKKTIQGSADRKFTKIVRQWLIDGEQVKYIIK